MVGSCQLRHDGDTHRAPALFGARMMLALHDVGSIARSDAI